jgi:predicted alpha/beta superfamily hydrolase
MKRALFALVFLCLAAGFAGAGEPIIIGETITLPSKIMGEERTILVSTPPGYEQSSGGYAVLYMTDGNAHFTHTRGTVDFLARNGVIPQLIIVAVANTDRTRDLSPTHVASRTVNGRVFENPTSGGAPKFLDFFERELFPYIDSNYRPCRCVCFLATPSADSSPSTRSSPVRRCSTRCSLSARA